MPSVKFPKEHLQELIWEDELDGLKIIQDRITSNGRWSIHHELIFQDLETKKFYLTNYSIGATESQDERPFEYDGPEILCTEVEAVEKVIIVYQKV